MNLDWSSEELKSEQWEREDEVLLVWTQRSYWAVWRTWQAPYRQRVIYSVYSVYSAYRGESVYSVYTVWYNVYSAYTAYSAYSAYRYVCSTYSVQYYGNTIIVLPSVSLGTSQKTTACATGGIAVSPPGRSPPLLQMVLGGIGWCWVVQGGIGWCWVVLGDIGWYWVVLGGIG